MIGMRGNNLMFRLKLHVLVNNSVNSWRISTTPSLSRVNFSRQLEWGVTTHNPMFRLKLHVSVNISLNSWWNYHKPPQTMTWTTTNDEWIITNHYKSPQVFHDMNPYKSQITTNHHKPWHKPPWTMTETSTKHDMNHYKSPQTMTWTIMMTQKELCIKPYGFLVSDFTWPYSLPNPPTQLPIHPLMGVGVSTDVKSSNRAEISQFVLNLLNFYWNKLPIVTHYSLGYK